MINLRAYWAYTRSTLQLTMRDRTVLFFSYLFPLIFFIAFGEGLGAAQGAGAATQVIVMVLVLGVLGNGFFGGGMRATHERETGILRRFKVAPITPAPILVASIVTGWVIYMPAIFLFFGISRWRYGLPFPENWVSLLVFLFFGVIAFRSMGLIVAAVVNSMAESQIIIQLLYFPMLLLSGATIPLSILPEWLQVIAQFLPATHLYLGMQGILMKNETLFDQAAAVGALTLATVVCLFIGVKLFRWEKDDRLKPSAKLWVAAALLPFLLIGGWQAYSLENLRKTRIIDREQRRSLSWLIRDARVFIGDGEVLEIGTVLVRGGRIEAVWPGRGPDPREIRAEMLEAAGRTLLPGFIDAWVLLPEDAAGQRRALASMLYCGVTGVSAASVRPEILASVAASIEEGEWLGASVLAIAMPDPPAGPPLVAQEWIRPAEGMPLLLNRSLTQQVLNPSYRAALAQQMRDWRDRPEPGEPGAVPDPPYSAAGLWMLPHGPALHRQLQLMAAGGLAASEILKQVTSGAAARFGKGNIGQIRPGADADLVLVDGNPLEDINATERIIAVFSKGERVDRPSLLEH
ncbi:MAG: ABC transporter permease [Bryobacteraceae bacterium]|nr:ABC transporter permease [Bryobacteraceae bacterium]